MKSVAGTVTATLGGVAATALYAGNTPGVTDGLQQFNLRVPAGKLPKAVQRQGIIFSIQSITYASPAADVALPSCSNYSREQPNAQNRPNPEYLRIPNHPSVQSQPPRKSLKRAQAAGAASNRRGTPGYCADSASLTTGADHAWTQPLKRKLTAQSCLSAALLRSVFCRHPSTLTSIAGYRGWVLRIFMSRTLCARSTVAVYQSGRL